MNPAHLDHENYNLQPTDFAKNQGLDGAVYDNTTFVFMNGKSIRVSVQQQQGRRVASPPFRPAACLCDYMAWVRLGDSLSQVSMYLFYVVYVTKGLQGLQIISHNVVVVESLRMSILTTSKEKQKTFFKQRIVSLLFVSGTTSAWLDEKDFILPFKKKKKKFLFHLFCLTLMKKAQFSLLTYLRLVQFSCTEIGSFPDDFMS